MILSDVLLQILQVLCVLLLAPLLQGFILKVEERVQRSRGPSIFQPYRDLWKLFHKESVAPESASWIYFTAPIVAFTAMLTVPILIPVLTDRPLRCRGIPAGRHLCARLSSKPGSDDFSLHDLRQNAEFRKMPNHTLESAGSDWNGST